MPAPEAIKWFVVANHEWPSRTVMPKFMRAAGFEMADARGKSWEAYCEDAKPLLAAAGVRIPPPPKRRGGRGVKRTFVVPENMRKPLAGPWADRAACVDAVARWLLRLRAGDRQSRKAYAAFAVGKPDFPSPSRLDENHGGWSAILADARVRAREMRAAESA